MGNFLEMNIEGMPSMTRQLSAVEGSFKRWALLFEGLIRPTKLPSGHGWIVEPEYTLEGATRAAFENNGVSVYNPGGWEGYENEPEYARWKEEQGGGHAILVWEGSDSPLMETFLNDSDDDPIERITDQGFTWGPKRFYAARLHFGDFFQPWDGVDPGPRPIFVVNDLMAFHLAKGAQRLMMDAIRESTTGANRGAAIDALRNVR